MGPGSRNRSLLAVASLVLILACTLPWTAGGTDAAATMVVETVAALQTSLSASQTAVPPATVPPTLPLPIATAPPPATPTFSNPVVKTTALCWTGPGSAYPVVSGIKQGIAVEVLGVGSKVGWLVVNNPTYRDPCWIEVDNLQLDPYFTTAGLRVFNPPPTPGPKITPGPSPTP
ncbi:MAG TPA: hypothetical protein VLL49_11855 [Anaerolineales bacterium]|nr:hypothetical protein [Anaerolineales bacterium]